MNISQLTKIAVTAAKLAGQEILKIYHSADFGVEMKSDDSPLTLADKAAHEEIMKYLSETGLPVLSEEGKSIPYEERKNWEYFWMVDPLDGTKEFIKKNGEFTVNIALIHRDTPVMGVVYAPVLDRMYWGNAEEGVWKQEGKEKARMLKRPENKMVRAIVASRSHLSPETQEVIDRYPDAEVISMGSSLKFMLLAEGKAQLYPRFAPTMEWDTAAAHGVLLALGFTVKKTDNNQPLLYNKQNLLNPFFICEG
ncbi:3'(2'),5'-bisphosphate nucleotidase CysQ [Cyclobacterium sp.]|uniref:3'(2'),5'-bisphosphate nucleotidase CysQ n=1 Tax=Cyclobacterium sp. TaxID=1966343 RepID=UPI0019C3E801|nr:3'(2'),5'-bisphosphate nucleotidase CysQ [Cyclobacterium sp.]MBD3629411.1 3'(2'),5'-bisphosphate nucleotidase CysQ [Cyclobacterium sp.]